MPGPIRTILPKPARMRRLRLGRPSTWWPSVAMRQDEAFRNIWQALRQHGRLIPAGPSVGPGNVSAQAFVVCVIRPPDTEALAEALKPLRQELSGYPFVRLASAPNMAITIQELGFLVDEPSHPTETSRELIEEFIRHATVPICDFPKFEVTLGGFNSFLDTPFLDVHDDGWCFRVHHRLRDFTLLPLEDSYAYLPHLPLGLYTDGAELRDFPARMARWRDRTFVTFAAEAVEILAVPVDDPLADPEVLHCFDLGQSLGAAETITQSSPGEMFG